MDHQRIAASIAKRVRGRLTTADELTRLVSSAAIVRRCLALMRAACCAASYSLNSSGGVSATAVSFAALSLPRHAGESAFGPGGRGGQARPILTSSWCQDRLPFRGSSPTRTQAWPQIRSCLVLTAAGATGRLMLDADKLTAASPENLAAALAFALRYEGRKRVHNADEVMSESLRSVLCGILSAPALSS